MTPVVVLSCVAFMAAEISAMDCRGSSCMEDDVTSLMQINKVTISGEDRGDQGPIIMNAAIDKSVQDMDDAIHDTVLAHKVISNARADSDEAAIVGASPIPPPVGHGHIRDNPTVVAWKAAAETMPGNAGGAVVAAYDASFEGSVDPARNPLVQQYARNMARQDEMSHFNHDMLRKIHKQEDRTAKTAQKASQAILNTAADTREVEKAAMHTVAKATKAFEESAIKKQQVEAAALAGHAQGVQVGLENAAQAIASDTNARAKAAQLKAQMQAREARAKLIKEGITAADNYQAHQEAATDIAVAHMKKQQKAIRAQMAAQSGAIRDSIEGAQAVKDRIITNAADQEAMALNRNTMSNEETIAKTVIGGAPAVMRDMIAGAVAPSDMAGAAAVMAPGSTLDSAQWGAAFSPPI